MDEIEAHPHPFEQELDTVAEGVAEIILSTHKICTALSKHLDQITDHEKNQFLLLCSFVQPLENLDDSLPPSEYLRLVMQTISNVGADTMPIWSQMLIQGQTAVMGIMTAQQRAE